MSLVLELVRYCALVFVVCDDDKDFYFKTRAVVVFAFPVFFFHLTRGRRWTDLHVEGNF